MLTSIIVLVAIAFLVGLLLRYVPMPPPLRTVILGIVVVAFVLWALQAFGVVHLLDAPLPRVR